jgi:hypothetical protein
MSESPSSPNSFITCSALCRAIAVSAEIIVRISSSCLRALIVKLKVTLPAGLPSGLRSRTCLMQLSLKGKIASQFMQRPRLSRCYVLDNDVALSSFLASSQAAESFTVKRLLPALTISASGTLISFV